MISGYNFLARSAVARWCRDDGLDVICEVIHTLATTFSLGRLESVSCMDGGVCTDGYFQDRRQQFSRLVLVKIGWWRVWMDGWMSTIFSLGR